MECNDDWQQYNKHGTLSDEFLCFKEAAKVFHLPESNNNQQQRLGNCPPQNTLICTLACFTKPILAPLQCAATTAVD